MRHVDVQPGAAATSGPLGFLAATDTARGRPAFRYAGEILRDYFGAGGMERLWDWIGHFLLRRAGTIWLATAAIMAPFAILGGLLYNHVTYDLIANLPADSSSTVGTRLLQEHFPAGIVGTASMLLVDSHTDFRTPQGRAVVENVTDQLRQRKDDLGLADVRSLTSPLGITKQAGHDYSGLDVPAEVRRESTESEAPPIMSRAWESRRGRPRAST